MATATAESADTGDTAHQTRIQHLQSVLGPLFSNTLNDNSNNHTFDDFQLTLFDLLCNASDDGIQQCFHHKSNGIYKFILTLYIASLHAGHPSRLTSISEQHSRSQTTIVKAQKEQTQTQNPLQSVLISPPQTLPPPPKRNQLQVHPTGNKIDRDENIASPSSSAKADGIDTIALKKNLSEIDELQEKGKHIHDEAKVEAAPIANVRQASLRDEDFFHELLADVDVDDDSNHNNNGDEDEDFHDFSKTQEYESFQGDFFAQRTQTSREHTTAEKFKCNPKERAIVDDWRRDLLQDDDELKMSAAGGVTPTPRVNMDDDDDEDAGTAGDDAVLVKSAEQVREQQADDDDDIVLLESAEMIAPMTRIRGKLKVSTTSITFIPDQEQGGAVSKRHRDEINLAMNPPPLPVAPQVGSSRSRAQSSGAAVGGGGVTLNTLRATSIIPKESKSAAASVTSSAHVTVDADTNSDIERKDTDRDLDPKLSRRSSSHSQLLLHASSPIGVQIQATSSNEDIGSSGGGGGGVGGGDTSAKQFWVATSVCSSYQQVGGTRYRLMSAHRRWFLHELREIYYRRYQLRECAVELFFSDDTSWLFNLYDEHKRDMIFAKIMSLSPSNLIEKPEYFTDARKAIKTSQIHHKWCRRELSNFEYLMKLNTLAGRTFNDLTQYPVVPWVLRDFESDSLDLSDERVYRDLSKPMGALNEERAAKFMERYESLMEDWQLCASDEERQKMHCFMYGTHYSSIGIVLYYLLRMQPFTTYNLKFQGGRFDHPDRLFHSLLDTWNGCLLNTSDVKELIPEFYYLTDFLCNKQDLELGARQDGATRVGDVVLPPWSKQSPEKFVTTMREALESEYVSAHLHEWIDLIFGYKQRGAESVRAHNVFHPYTYQGNVDIDKIEDVTQRRAILSQIDEFGQTSAQLFSKAHPKRLKQTEVLNSIFEARVVKYYGAQHLTESSDVGVASLSWSDKNVYVIGSDCCLDVHRWEQNKLSIEKRKNSSISRLVKIGKSKKHNKIGQANFSTKLTHRNLCFATTKDGQYSFACGFEDNSFVVWDVDKSKLHQGIHKHNDTVSCLALDEDVDKQRAVLVTGSFDKCVMVWRVNVNAKQRNKDSKKRNKKHQRRGSDASKLVVYTEIVDPNPTHVLDNQLAAVMCVDVSLTSGIIVCCCLDGIVNVYNASTGEHYHMLQPFVDKAIKLESQRQTKSEKEKEKEKEDQDDEKNIQDNDDGDDGGGDDDEVQGTGSVGLNDMLSPLSTLNDEAEMDFASTEQEQEQEHKEETEIVYDENVSSKMGSIPSGELTIVRVSDVFGHVLCYSQQTKDIFLYSSAGQLKSWSHSRDDVYHDIQFSKAGNHIVCGGTETIIRVKELPSFRTRKKFVEAKKPIRCLFLDKDETYMLAGTANGNVLVYSLPQKAFVKSRVHTLTELGF